MSLGRLAAIAATAAILQPAAAPIRAQDAPSDAVSRTLEAKIALEASLERRVVGVLKDLLGAERIIVIINVELVPQAQLKPFDILPGVPIQETPIAAALAPMLTMVRRMQCTILLDKSTPDALVEQAKKTASELLGLNAERGDALIIERAEFHRPTPVFVPSAPWWSRLADQAALWTGALMIVGLAGFGVLYVGFLTPFLRVLNRVITALESRSEPGGGAAGPITAAPIGAQTVSQATALPSSADGASQRRFGFLTREHVPTLLHALKKAAPEAWPVVVHYAPPDVAAALMAQLDPDARSQVAMRLTKVVEVSEPWLKQLEAYVRFEIEHAVGGEAKVLELLDGLPDDEQEATLRDIAVRDAAMAERLKARLVWLEDIVKLEPRETSVLIRKVGMGPLALALRSNDELAKKFVERLSEGMRERFKDEVKLSEGLPKERLDAERRRVVAAMKELAREGQIVLRREPK